MLFSTTDPEPQPTAGNAKIRKGQGYANKFANAGISITGKRDAATKKAGVKVLQTALNRDYGAGLDVDGIWGTNTDNALGQHYVKNGETQYMVTAAEILLLLRAYDPNGVEIPGTFGSGLLSAVKAFQKAQGLTVSGTCDSNTFLNLIILAFRDKHPAEFFSLILPDMPHHYFLYIKRNSFETHQNDFKTVSFVFLFFTTEHIRRCLHHNNTSRFLCL